MDWIVTLPEWESKTPLSYRRRSESLWRAVELPLNSEFVFIVNTREDRATRRPARSTAVVTTPQLLDFLERMDPLSVSSAYVVVRSDEGEQGALKIYRLTAIRAGDAEQLGWNRILAFESDEGTVFTDPNLDDRVQRWANETAVYLFNPETQG
jgi:hypothetical protein